MDFSECEAFFEKSQKPGDLDNVKKEIDDFIKKHVASNHKIVLVTSGGTAVPMESRTVRYIDNFSVGTRGATSAEYFLASNYVVIFLHRRGSLKPYQRHFQNVNILDLLQISGSDVIVQNEHKARIHSILNQYQQVISPQSLLLVEFTTLEEYLYNLRMVTEGLSMVQKSALLYLAAAVSDFYIPPEQLPEHKIQSSGAGLTVHLQAVPKMLKPLVSSWAPNAFTVTFKLETNPNLLVSKAREALKRYKHQVVVGNILERRKFEVVLVTEEAEQWLRLTEAEQKTGLEIESKIIDVLTKMHERFMSETTAQ